MRYAFAPPYDDYDRSIIAMLRLGTTALLDLALSFKNGGKSVNPAVESQAYQDWVSPENDIYDEVFADELTAR